MTDLKALAERLKLRGYILQKRLEQIELEIRYRLELRDKDDYIQDPKTGLMLGRKPSVRDCGEIKQLTDIDNTAAHKLVKGFEGDILDEHWDGSHSHKDQYPGFTKEQYAQRARELLEMPVNKRIRGYAVKSQGMIVRYDTKTNDYVKGHFRQGIITMFKPKSKTKYYESKRKSEKD